MQTSLILTFSFFHLVTFAIKSNRNYKSDRPGSLGHTPLIFWGGEIAQVLAYTEFC